MYFGSYKRELIVMENKIVRFGELYQIPSSNGLSRPSAVRGIGFKMINMGELFANNIISDIPMERVQMSESEQKKFFVEQGDLLFARQSLVAEGAGKCSIIKLFNEPTTFESHLIRVRLNQKIANPWYYYYLFQLKSNPIKAIINQCAQAGIRGSELARVKVPNPPLPTQQKIASILSAYDNLIQNYKKQIEALQTGTCELYKEWFVRFRFPGYQTTKFENGIPEGWKVEKLFDVAKIIYGYPFNSDEFCDDSTLNPVVRIRDILDNHTDTYTSEPCDEKYWINPNEMLIGMDGIFHMTLWTGERALQNQRTVRVSSKTKNLSNYYLYFSLYPQIKALEQMIVGTTVAHLGDKYLKKITILVPAEKILKMSYERLEPIMNRIYSLQQQITNLTQQRDLLLPRLMSGKLEVK